jgi:hypothetical protein
MMMMSPGEEEKKMALSFMAHFPDDMDTWYEYMDVII